MTSLGARYRLVSFDAAHPDYVQVHRVGVFADELGGTPIALEAKASGTLFAGALLALSYLGRPLGTAP